jgi:hypothetical protein
MDLWKVMKRYTALYLFFSAGLSFFIFDEIEDATVKLLMVIAIQLLHPENKN